MRSPVSLYAGGSEQLEFSASSPSLPSALSSSLVPRSLFPVPPRGRIEGMRGIPTLGSVPASSFLRVVPRRSREQEHASRCAVRWSGKCQQRKVRNRWASRPLTPSCEWWVPVLPGHCERLLGKDIGIIPRGEPSGKAPSLVVRTAPALAPLHGFLTEAVRRLWPMRHIGYFELPHWLLPQRFWAG